MLLGLHGVPLGPLHDADVGDGLDVVRVALQRQQVLLHRALRLAAKHLDVAHLAK